jgi:hypothetical protein
MTGLQAVARSNGHNETSAGNAEWPVTISLESINWVSRVDRTHAQFPRGLTAAFWLTK